jgi:serine/threonine-protein kinase
MSPEQEQGGDIDARSDLYATGAVIYECFVGLPPPTTASGSFEIAATLSKSDAPTPAPDRQIPPEWRTIVNRAMAPLPQSRYRDARAMREAVAKLGQAASSGEADLAGDAESGTKSATEVRKTNVSK